ncbi:hypothetical protein [Burkholderia gladioli]|uniref:hypothetical protein n=1 Tax=Burkholderia gladioli TaxID=28095 RepID=UPI0019177D83|nr:hypothetical protein [Burkholderia gladioli]
MNAPLSGADRYVNADEFFGVGGHFFLVEFKSSEGNLKDESRKASACTLCGRLNDSIDARLLHDVGHFAAWGRKEYNGPLQTRIGVYRKLVCRTDVLASCEHAVAPQDDWQAIPGDEFLTRAEDSNLGLDAEKFKTYLRWLLDSPPGDGSPPDFPLVVFGFTYSEGIQDKRFSSYADFSHWAAAAVQYAKKIGATKKFGP